MADKHIDRLRRSLEDHLNWGPSQDWHSSVFQELSDLIFDRTQIMISPTTLKRFFGVVKYDGAMSVNTLDSLSSYLGYQNWRDFRQKQDIKKTKPRVSRIKGVPKKSIYIGIGFSAALFMVFLLSTGSPPEPIDFSGIRFSSHSVSEGFPNSVVFNLELGANRPDSVVIQQYWDKTKTIHMDAEESQATGIYYFPGYFRAKLILDGILVSEHDLFLSNQGWLGTVDHEPVPAYFKPIRDEGIALELPEEFTPELESLEEEMTTRFHLIEDYGNVSGDNFRLKARIKNNTTNPWGVCKTVWIYIIGSKGAMIFPFGKTGCSSDMGMMVNDVYRNGKRYDLSALGCDLTDFTDIEILNKEQEVEISINSETVLTQNYEKTMGRFVGFRFKFLGWGEVESYSVWDKNETRFISSEDPI